MSTEQKSKMSKNHQRINSQEKENQAQNAIQLIGTAWNAKNAQINDDCQQVALQAIVFNHQEL